VPRISWPNAAQSAAATPNGYDIAETAKKENAEGPVAIRGHKVRGVAPSREWIAGEIALASGS
jgi:hypothetical protein